VPVECEIVGELTETDIGRLGETRGVQSTSLKSIRDSHHRVARLVAQGLSGAEIGMMTGYSQSRISILKGDPAFNELCEFYRGQVAQLEHDALAEAIAKSSLARNLALDKMVDLLEEDKVDLEGALDIYKVTADRTGMGPATKSTNLNVNVDLADRIAAGRRRVSQLGAAGPQPEAAPTSAVQLEPPRKTEGEE
jgi:hypothetical protein